MKRMWTIQPRIVYDIVKEKGFFNSNPRYSENTNSGIYVIDKDFRKAYDFLISKLKDELLLNNPYNAVTPIWAYYTFEGKNIRPNSRIFKARKPYVVLELLVPDNEVVLIDSNNWTIVLNDSPIYFCKNEYEYDLIDEFYSKNLIESEKETFKLNSWNDIFDLTDYSNDPQFDKEWVDKHDELEAVFWTLKKEYIVKKWFYN